MLGLGEGGDVMAKRFGRNQRRKMRDEIASVQWELKSSRKSENETNARYVELSRRLTSWAEEVLRLMGQDSAFNEQVRRMAVEDVRSYGGVLRLAPPIRMPVFSPREKPIPLSSYTVIEALIWRLHVSADEFSDMVRIELENRHAESVGYALSRKLGWGEKDAEYLARQIARQLIAVMQQGKAA
jgi:hypothetical protein